MREEDEMVAVIDRTTIDLRGRVLGALASRTEFEFDTIEVEAHDGVVTLGGVVDCLAKRRTADEVARGVHGVHSVIDEIQIARDRTYGWRDIDLLEGANRILKVHYLFAGKKLTVSAYDGYVTLQGRVASLRERLEAERAISILPNLRGIRDEIEVVPPRVDPDILRLHVADALHTVLGSDAESVDIRVSGRTVSLLGTVRTWRDKVACREAISALRGVAAIDDLLDVG